MQETTIKILFFAGVASIIIGLFNTTDQVEGISIIAACLFITLLSSLCNWGKEKQYLKLHDEIRNEKVAVFRGQYGLSQDCLVTDLVVGDVILVESGMRIPADCFLIDGMDISVDESMYFGHSANCKKALSLGEDEHRNNPDPFLLTKSLIRTGSGRAVVCAVGEHTRWTKENPVEDLEDDNNLTPLQTKLDLLAKYIGKWSYIAGFLTFVFMILYLTLDIMISADELLSNRTLEQMLNIFTIAVAIVIVSVPEGLPLAVSLAMAFSVDYMKKDNLLVKKMAACETLGYIKDICTGKTATLTQNNMRVLKYFTGETQYDFKDGNKTELSTLNLKLKDTIVSCIIMNCDARIEMSEEGLYEPTGNGTEVAMLHFLLENEIDLRDLISKRQTESEHECSIPFNSIRKRQTTVIRPQKGAQKVRIVVKGAPEIVMKFCTKYLRADGEEEYLGNDQNE